MKDGKLLVFISHSSKDTWVARQIEREIKARNAVTFLDYADIPIGVDFEERIKKNLNAADEFLILLTPWTLVDHLYIWSEAGVAWGREIPIVGVLHGMSVSELLTTPGVPAYLKAKNLVEINSVEQYFEQLGQRVNAPQPPAE